MPRLVGAAQTVISETQDAVITTFNSSGTFTAAPLTTQANILVLAGGGGGGAVGIGGGGGAGFGGGGVGDGEGGGGEGEGEGHV